MAGWSMKSVCVGALGVAVLLAACGIRRPLDQPSLRPYKALMREPQSMQGPLRIWFLGASTIVLRDEESTILIDGFFTRPSSLPMLLSPLKSDRDRVEEGMKLGGFEDRPEAQALFVAHAHHDHVLDLAAVANWTGATLIGDSSSVNVARGELEGNFCVAEQGDRFKIGNFTVRVFVTPHSKGDIAPIRGRVTSSKARSRWLADYRTRTSHAYHIEHVGSDGRTRRILIVPSANFSPDSSEKPGSFEKVEAEVVFLAVAKLHKLPRGDAREYWKRAVEDTNASLVIPIHWDDIRDRLADKSGGARPFETIPYLQDDFRKAMAIILPLALSQKVEVRIPARAGPIQANPAEAPWWPVGDAGKSGDGTAKMVPWKLPRCGKR